MNDVRIEQLLFQGKLRRLERKIKEVSKYMALTDYQI